MKDDQKIFDLFRNNEHKLHEYPSADAWLKLEKKLEARRKRRRIALFRPLAMAAGLALVIGTAFILGWVANSLTQSSQNSLTALSDLPPAQGVDPYAQTLSMRRQYAQAQVEEGSGQKRFRVNEPPREVAAAVPQAGDVPDEDLAAASIPEAQDEMASRQYSRSAPSPAKEQSDFEWLEGTWIFQGDETPLYEEWTPSGERLWKGIAYKMSGTRKVVLWEMEIRQENGVWTMQQGEIVRPVTPEGLKAGWKMRKLGR